jgi:hypothetical protein
MGKYKFKLSEVDGKVLKPKDVDPALIKRIEIQYGPVDMVNDFFSSDLKTYFKTDSVNPETGSISHELIQLASFTESFSKLYSTIQAFKNLLTSPEGKNDKVVNDTLVKLKDLFNAYRTYLRKYYPDQYEAVKSQLDEISSTASNSFFTSGGEGENHTGPSPRKSTYGAYTQAGYKKVNEGPGATMGPGPKAGPEGVKDNMYVKKFKYKLVDQPALNKAAKGIEVKQLWTEANTDVETYLQDASINDPKNKKFVASRILAFDELERKLNQLVPLLQQAKHKTLDYYKQNPASFGVVYGTDLANDYLNDLIELFKD